MFSLIQQERERKPNQVTSSIHIVSS